MNRACDLIAILLALSAIAAQPMPADKCIPAHVDRTIGEQLIMPSDVTTESRASRPPASSMVFLPVRRIHP